MKLGRARITHIPSSMMNMTIDFVETSFSIGTYHRQKMVVTRMKLGHASMTHTPRSMMKIIINFVDRSSFSKVTIFKAALMAVDMI